MGSFTWGLVLAFFGGADWAAWVTLWCRINSIVVPCYTALMTIVIAIIVTVIKTVFSTRPCHGPPSVHHANLRECLTSGYLNRQGGIVGQIV